MQTLRYSFFIVLISLFLHGCSSGEGFHLRGHGNIPSVKESFYIEGINIQSPFGISLRDALNQSGSTIVQDRSQASVILTISNLLEDKVAAGYSRARKVREYDIFLKFHYSFRSAGEVENYTPRSSDINLSRTQLYDSDFALGKAEEEKTIRKELRQNAARLILLKLRYSHKVTKTPKTKPTTENNDKQETKTK